MALVLNQELYFLAILSIFYPIYILYKLYSKTKILDFLLFSWFFILSLVIGFSNILGGLTDQLFFYQLFEITFDFWYIILLIHALRLKSKRVSKLILGCSLVYFLFLLILVIFWKTFPQPDSAVVIFVTLKHNYSSFYPNGAGFKVNNIIIYSSGFRMLGDLFRLVISSYLLYLYLKLKPILKVPQILKARKLWIVAWIVFLIWNILIALPFSSSTPLGLILLSFAILVTYISWRYPESMVISQAQSIRAMQLYDLIDKDKMIKNIEEHGLESFSTYIKLLYDEFNF